MKKKTCYKLRKIKPKQELALLPLSYGTEMLLGTAAE